MRILHITNKYPNAIGGDAEYVANLTGRQEGEGNDVFILTANCKEVIYKKNLYKFGLNSKPKDFNKIGPKRIISLLFFFVTLPRLLERIRPDIIHVHAVELGCLSSQWARIYKIPVVLTCHSVLFPYKDINLAKRVLDLLFLKLGKFDKIITVDHSSLGEFKKYNFKNYSYLPTGVDLGVFRAKEDSKVTQNVKIKFLFVGRLEKIKGIDFILYAAKLLLEKRENFEIIIIGEGADAKRLKRISRKLSLDSYICFRDTINDKKEIAKAYNACDVFILPSLREWCPLVIFEAWASKLAVIVTSTGSIPAICTHLKDAFLIPTGNISALFQAMLTLSENEGIRKNIAANGRLLAENKFSWEVIHKGVMDIYCDLINYKTGSL